MGGRAVVRVRAAVRGVKKQSFFPSFFAGSPRIGKKRGVGWVGETSFQHNALSFHPPRKRRLYDKEYLDSTTCT